MVMEIVLSLALLVVGIGVLVVIHICVVGRAFRNNGGYPNNGGNGGFVHSATGPRISIEDLQKLPRFDYKSGEKEKERKGSQLHAVDCCAVCLESFRAGESCRLLPNCMHSFHSHCIDSWLLKSPICPICRAAIRAPSASCRAVEEDGEDGISSSMEIRVELSQLT